MAARLGMRYLDTGAMYRALALAAVHAGLNPDDPDAIGDWITGPHAPVICSGTDPQNPTIQIDGLDVSAPIRSQEVTDNVSAVSAVPQIRSFLMELQRAEAAGATAGIVLEGRDIGSVVLPDADVKVFLTAHPTVRAQRRAAETSQEINAALIAATRESLQSRDTKDSTRAVSPLTRADGAVEVDTSNLSFDDVVDVIVGLIHDKEHQT